MKNPILVTVFFSLFLVSCWKNQEFIESVRQSEQIVQTGGTSASVPVAINSSVIQKNTDSGSLKTENPSPSNNQSGNKVDDSAVDKWSLSKEKACLLSDGNYIQWLEVSWTNSESFLQTSNFLKTAGKLWYLVHDLKMDNDAVARSVFLYTYDCQNKSKTVLNSESFGSGPYFRAEISGVTDENVFIYTFWADSVWYNYGKNYAFNLKTKKYTPVFDYIKTNQEEDWVGWEWDVIFNKGYTKAIKFQNYEDMWPGWIIDWLVTDKKSYLLITDILTKKTKLIEDGIIDYSYMDGQYRDYIKWTDENHMEVLLKDKTRKTIEIK